MRYLANMALGSISDNDFAQILLKLSNSKAGLSYIKSLLHLQQQHALMS